MRSDRLTRVCDQTVEYGWLLIALALPLYFNVYSSRIFEPDKVALFRSIVLVMIGAWLIGWLEGRSSTTAGRARPTPVQLSVLALVGTWLLATATSLSPRISLWGSYEWRQGSYTLVCYLALFSIAASRLHAPKPSERLLTAVLLASAPVSAYGIVQYAGLDLLPWQPAATDRAVSNLGHPNFLGAYIVMVAPLTAVRMLTATRTPHKVAYGGLLLGQGLCLLFTFSRGGWLAAFGGGLTFVFLLAQIRGRARLFWRVAATVALLVAGVCALAYADPGGLFSYSPLEPLHSMLRGKSAAARIRLLEWQATPSLIAARPLLGFGPDTFPLAFSRVYPPELTSYGGPDATGDHAHNLLLDMVIEAGLLGVASYLAVIVVVVAGGLTALRRRTDPGRQLLLVGLISAVVAYLLMHQFSFVTVTPSAFLWLYLGWIVADRRDAAPPAQLAAAVPVWRMAMYGLCAAGTVGLIAVTNVRPVVADVCARQAAILAGESRWEYGIAASQWAVRLAPRQDRYYAELAKRYMESEEADEPTFRQAEAALAQAIRLSPYDLDYYLDLAELHYQWGTSLAADHLDLALAACRQAAELSPTDPRVYVGWGRIHESLGQYETAIERYKAALALDQLHVPAYIALGNLYEALGEPEKANQAYADGQRASEIVDRLISKR